MIKWKDFLYFSKGDKIGILILLVLIAITGAISVYLNQFLDVDPSYFAQQQEVQNDFIEFENNLIDQSIIEPDTTNTVVNTSKSKKTTTSKLESGQVIDINSASVATLTRIPGIGNTFAERIIEYRNSLGGFYSLDQLQEVKGITRNKFSKVLPFIIIKKKHKTIRISKVTKEQLLRHPYFKEHHIDAIFDLRDKAKINSIDILTENENFIANDIEKMTPYISFE